MARQSPLRRLQEQAEAEFIAYGDHRRGGDKETDSSKDAGLSVPIDIVATYGEIEAEYAALRKAAGLMERPQRGTLRITGSQRRDFLNRMITNEVKNLSAGQVVQAFWLNRKGRIDADLTLIETGEVMYVDLDIFHAASTAAALNDFLFSEDVHIEDVSEQFHGLSLHGGKAIELLRKICDDSSGTALSDLTPGHCLKIRIGTVAVVVDRRDTAGEVGLELLVPVQDALSVHEQIVEVGLGAGLRSMGWMAYNIGRIEAGTPIFMIDFGGDSLPHETGVLEQRVSFTKGCYLGQEIVARMQSLGHPSKRLVGLKIEGDNLPVTGSQVFPAGDHVSEVIGAVTSSTPSPMLGRTMIAFAMVKYAQSNVGTRVLVNAEGTQAQAEVHPLQFWSRSTM